MSHGPARECTCHRSPVQRASVGRQLVVGKGGSLNGCGLERSDELVVRGTECTRGRVAREHRRHMNGKEERRTAAREKGSVVTWASTELSASRSHPDQPTAPPRDRTYLLVPPHPLSSSSLVCALVRARRAVRRTDGGPVCEPPRRCVVHRAALVLFRLRGRRGHQLSGWQEDWRGQRESGTPSSRFRVRAPVDAPSASAASSSVELTPPLITVRRHLRG